MYKIEEMRQAKDPELYVNMVMNNPEHIARSMAKVNEYRRAKEELKRQEKFALAFHWGCLAVIASFVLTAAIMILVV